MLNEQWRYRNFLWSDSTQSCLVAYVDVKFIHDTQKKYFDFTGQMRSNTKKLGHKGRAQESRMRVGTWNIRTLRKCMEVVKVRVNRMISMMCIQETK